VSHVEGVGILRMTHRAATENERVWYRETAKECQRALLWIEAAARQSLPQAAEKFGELVKANKDEVDNSM